MRINCQWKGTIKMKCDCWKSIINAAGVQEKRKSELSYKSLDQTTWNTWDFFPFFFFVFLSEQNMFVKLILHNAILPKLWNCTQCWHNFGKVFILHNFNHILFSASSILPHPIVYQLYLRCASLYKSSLLTEL